MVLKIAFKNLSEHKVRSIIVGGLVALGMFLLVLTFSIGETSNQGIEKTFIKSFSGHILVGLKGKDDAPPQIMAGTGFGNFEEAKSMPKYEELYQDLKKFDFIKAMNPQLFTVFRMDIHDTWSNFQGFGLGYNLEAYNQMFPDNLNIVEGTMPTEQEPGALVPFILLDRYKKAAIRDALKEIKPTLDEVGKKLSDDQIVDKIIDGSIKLDKSFDQNLASASIKVGDKIKLQGFAGGGRIKSLVVRGIYKYKSDDAMLESALMLDLSSIRYLSGLVVGTAKTVLDAQDQKLLNAQPKSEDDFFADSGVVGTVDNSKTLSQADYERILANNTETKNLNRPDEGAFNYILIRLKDGENLNQRIIEINELLKEKYPNLVAVDWKTAGGLLAATATIIQMVLIILIVLVVLVSIVIIINTMIASVIERTGEIGTMRALGAQRGFVRSVIGVESMMMSVLGAIAGLILALVVIFILNQVGIHTDNEILKTAFGSKNIHPVIGIPSIFFSFVIILGLGYLSSFYPTHLAMRISPLKAMQS